VLVKRTSSENHDAQEDLFIGPSRAETEISQSATAALFARRFWGVIMASSLGYKVREKI